MLKIIKNIPDRNLYASKLYFCIIKIFINMLNKIIAFSLLLLTVASCTKSKDVVDYGPIDKKIIQDYLIEKGVTNAQSTSSGLYYIIQNPGEDQHPTINSTLIVNYQGYLTDGTLFDSSASHGGPSTFALNSVVAGWQEGLQLIGKGGKIVLLCPSALGYGSTATGKIPANSVILFTIELISFQ
jgi:FKBP-type peptidyl-prolyl cis-trans isomerase FkpA